MSFGSDADEAAGHVEQPLLELGLARLPGDAAELVEDSIGSFRAVARQKLDIFHRQEQLGIVRIDELEAVMRCAGGLDRPEADEAPDAVLGVYDITALVEAGHFGDEIRARLRRLSGEPDGRRECPARR